MPIVDDNSTIPAPFPPQGEPQSQQIAEQGLPPSVPRDNRFFPTLPQDDIRNVFGAALNSENSVGEMINYAGYLWQLSGVDHTVDPNFDAWEQMKKDPGMEQYGSQLGRSRNQAEYDVMASKIKQEQANAATMGGAGITGTLVGLSAGLADPINFIPVIGGGEGIYRAAKFGRGTVEGLTHGATAGLFVGTAGAGVNYATNITPTLQDEAYNIGGSALFGGVLGGSFGALSDAIRGGKIAYDGATLKTPEAVSQSIADASRKYADNLTVADGEAPFYPAQAGAESVGAARAPGPDTTLEQEGFVPANIVPNKLAAALPDAISDKLDMSKALYFSDPTLALMNSPEIESRRIVQQLADVPAEVQKNREGIVSSPDNVEALIKQAEGIRARTDMAVHDLYNQYRFGRKTQIGDTLRLLPDAVRAPKDKMTIADFSAAVDTAMRNNDIHPVPEVQQAAKLYRDQVVEPLKQQAIKLGMLDPDVKATGAPSYAPISYNVPYVIANRPQLENIIARSFKRSNVNITERYDNFNAQAENSERLVKEFTQKGDDTRRLISEFTPLNRESVRNFNILQREMKVLAKQHDRLQRYADKAQERVKNMTPSEANAEFKKAINHVKNGIPKNQKANTLSEWVRSNGGLLDDEGGEVRAAGGGKDARLINNKSGMNLEDAAQRAQEAGYFPDQTERPTIRDFLDALQGDAQGSVPRYSDFDHENIAYEEYIDQLG